MTTVWISRRLIITIGLAILLAPSTAGAQQPADKIARIGVLADRPSSVIEALRTGLRELGWIEGRNLVLELRFSEARNEGPSALAAELVGLGVDLLMVPGPTFIEAARQATRTMPIVFCTHYGPVEAGHVASLTRPGGNLTGMTNAGSELTAKRLALLKEAVPGAQRIAVLWGKPTAARPVLERVEAAARALGVELQSVFAQNADELESAFATMARGRADAVLVPPSWLAFHHSARLTELALRHRLPTMFGSREITEVGGLMSYAADFYDQSRRCAGYADKILKGADPADLPVEQASKYEFVVNLKTAKALDLVIPPEILARADEAIE